MAAATLFCLAMAATYLAGRAIAVLAIRESDRVVTRCVAFPIGFMTIALLVATGVGRFANSTVFTVVTVALVVGALLGLFLPGPSKGYLPWKGRLVLAGLGATAILLTLLNGERIWHSELTVPLIETIADGHTGQYLAAPHGVRSAHFGYYGPAAYFTWLLPSHATEIHGLFVSMFVTTNIVLLFGVFWKASRSALVAGIGAFSLAWGDFPAHTGFLFTGLETFAMDGRVTYQTAAFLCLYMVNNLLSQPSRRAAAGAAIALNAAILNDPAVGLILTAATGLALLWTLWRRQASRSFGAWIVGVGLAVFLAVGLVAGPLEGAFRLLQPASCEAALSWVTDTTFLFPSLNLVSTRGYGVAPLRPEFLLFMSPLAAFGLVAGIPYLLRRTSFGLGFDGGIVLYLTISAALAFIPVNQVILNFKALNVYSAQIIFHSHLAALGGLAAAGLLTRFRLLQNELRLSGRWMPMALVVTGAAALVGSTVSLLMYRDVFWSSLFIMESRPSRNDFRLANLNDVSHGMGIVAARMTSIDHTGDAYRQYLKISNREHPLSLVLADPSHIYETAELSRMIGAPILGPTQFMDNSFHDLSVFYKTFDVEILRDLGVDYVFIHAESSVPRDSSAFYWYHPWFRDFAGRNATARLELTRRLGEPALVGDYQFYRVPPRDRGKPPRPTVVFAGGNLDSMPREGLDTADVLLAHAPCHRSKAGFAHPDRVVVEDNAQLTLAAWRLLDQYEISLKGLLRVIEANAPALNRSGNVFYPTLLFSDSLDNSINGAAIGFSHPSGQVGPDQSANIRLAPLPMAVTAAPSSLLIYASIPHPSCGAGSLRVVGDDGRLLAEQAVTTTQPHAYQWIRLALPAGQHRPTIVAKGPPLDARYDTVPVCGLYVNKIAAVPDAVLGAELDEAAKLISKN